MNRKEKDLKWKRNFKKIGTEKEAESEEIMVVMKGLMLLFQITASKVTDGWSTGIFEIQNISTSRRLCISFIFGNGTIWHMSLSSFLSRGMIFFCSLF